MGICRFTIWQGHGPGAFKDVRRTIVGVGGGVCFGMAKTGAVGPSKRSRPDCSVERRDGGAGGRTLWIGGLGIWGERRSKGKSDKARHAAACLLEGSTKGAGRPGGGAGRTGIERSRGGTGIIPWVRATRPRCPACQHGFILPDPRPRAKRQTT
jgi:hypothetical protein